MVALEVLSAIYAYHRGVRAGNVAARAIGDSGNVPCIVCCVANGTRSLHDSARVLVSVIVHALSDQRLPSAIFPSGSLSAIVAAPFAAIRAFETTRLRSHDFLDESSSTVPSTCAHSSPSALVRSQDALTPSMHPWTASGRSHRLSALELHVSRLHKHLPRRTLPSFLVAAFAAVFAICHSVRAH